MILTPTQDDLDLFAKLSGDANPIHVNPDFAARSGFGRTVAHGAMLTAWLVRAAGLSVAPQTTSAMFPAPAFAGEALEVSRDGDAWQLARRHDGVVVCRLLINATLAQENGAAMSGAAGVPLAIGMTASSETLLEAGELVALKALLARADKTDLPREVAEVFAGQAYMLGLISTLLGMELPGQGTNYLKQETQWLGTVVPGQRVHTRVAITRLRPEKALVDLSTQVQSESGEVLANGRALVSARDVSGAF
ncbi:R_hydratase_like domain containing protein [Caulobacteraceae bacterium]|jgi:acyl dehydratase